MLINRVKVYRESLGICQAELARRVGVTRQSMSIIEKGTCDPSIKTALKIAKALDVPLEKIWKLR